MKRLSNTKALRYAVVGQGYISQIAILPAFEHARNSKLVALVSGDLKKLKTLGKKYGVENLYTYDLYDDCLNSGKIDAVFIALPNHLHREYAVRAANAGIHVLCEKPMAVTSEDCQAIIDACQENKVKLMIAYRLHFEETNLKAVDLVQSGRIGEPRYFSSAFSLMVKDKNIRTLPHSQGGGPTYDIGIYCINAARMIFGEEPTEVMAISASSNKKAFENIEETMAVTLKFPGEKLASIVYSYGAISTGSYRVVGTRGEISVENAFEFLGDKKQVVKVQEKSVEKTFKSRDQFAPELLYFSEKVLNNDPIEPSGAEGLADVQIIEATLESAKTRRPVTLSDMEEKKIRPGLKQEIKQPKARTVKLVNAEQPSKKEAA